MAKATLSDTLSRKPSALLFIILFSTSISLANSLALVRRDTESCPSSYKQCGSSNLPSSFCCPDSSTCISLDDDSSAICCPKGESCAYIKPITCNVHLQNASKYPNNPVMSTRLGDNLPRCGGACCPFGYICQDGTCTLNNNTAATATSVLSSTFSTASATTISESTTASVTLSTTETASTTSPTGTQTPINLSTTSAPETASKKEKETCPSFPSGAVVAGFFPGMIIGAALVLLGLLCIRKRQNKKCTNTHQSYKPTQRTSNGTVINISSPIPSDESAYRTDFLLRPNNDGRKRNSDSARSMLHRTGSRVKSLFASTPRLGGPSNIGDHSNGRADSDDPVPAVPPLPLPVTAPRQIIPHRQPSMESIRVYSPAGGIAGGALTVRAVQYPTPARDRGRAVARSDTTFSQMIGRVGFQDGRGEPCYRVLDMPTPTPTPMPGERRRHG